MVAHPRYAVVVREGVPTEASWLGLGLGLGVGVGVGLGLGLGRADGGEL